MEVIAREDAGAVLYARVSVTDRKADLDRQVVRLAAFAAEGGVRVAKVEAEVPRSRSLPRIGCVGVKETPEEVRGRMPSATVGRETDRWYVSLAVEVERAAAQPVDGAVVGIEWGASFAVVSEGTRSESPNP